MRGYLAWLVVALVACSSMAEDSAKDSVEPAQKTTKDISKDSPQEPAEEFPQEIPAQDSAEDPAADEPISFEQLKAQLAAVLRDIKLEKREMQYNERMEATWIQSINFFTSGIPEQQEDLRAVKLQLAKVNVQLDRKNLVQEHCLDSEKYNAEVRRIAKERVNEKAAELESEARKELREKKYVLSSSITALGLNF